MRLKFQHGKFTKFMGPFRDVIFFLFFEKLFPQKFYFFIFELNFCVGPITLEYIIKSGRLKGFDLTQKLTLKSTHSLNPTPTLAIV